MNEMNYEFDARTLGKHYYIYEAYGNSGICTCGHHDLDIDRIIGVKECPNCHTKAIISIRTSSCGTISTDELFLQYLAFNENEFKISLKKMDIKIFLNTVVINNQPVYKIKKDSLETNIRDYKDLHFYYTTNKKGNKTIKSEFYFKGKKENFLASLCPSLYGVELVNYETRQALAPLSIDKYNNCDIWKIYSYYKHGKNLLEKGYTGIKGSVSELQTVDKLSIREDTAPLFDQMIEYYKYIYNSDAICYHSFKKLFGTTDYYYNPAKYESDFINFVLGISKETLKNTANQVHDTSSLFQFFKILDFTSEEAENFLQMSARQNVPLYSFTGTKIMQTAEILKKNGIKINKNIKDVRIFLSFIQMFYMFETYVYSNTKHAVKTHHNLQIELLSYENKITMVYDFLYQYTTDVITAITELLIEKKRYNLDVALLYRDEEVVKECLVIIDNSRNIYKILYKDIVLDNETEIKEFLNTLNNEGLGYAV